MLSLAAEMVETAEDARVLTNLGVDCLQAVLMWAWFVCRLF